MSNGTGTKWRFLIIEDKPDIAKQLEQACPGFVAPDAVEIEVFTKFKDVEPLLDSRRYDLLIIDLKDDSSSLPEDENLPGLKIFEAVKKRRFVPVVFYTALAKHVLPERTAFVRVVEKTEGLAKLESEVRAVFNTHLPALSRHLENEQREYFWDFLSKHWKEMVEHHDKVDLVYLVARRLAQTLRSDSIRAFVEKISHRTQKPLECKSAEKESRGTTVAEPQEHDDAVVSDTVHPVELYIYPCTDQHWLAGDIIQEALAGKKEYWLVLTPSCDFENKKADFVIQAKCQPLTEQKEYASWAANTKTPSKTAVNNIEGVISDNRGGQKDRFKFLPGTFFLPDLVVDFQQLRSVQLNDLNRKNVIASLDSPFAEAVLARFSRYFGRLGTPNLDKNVVLNRLQTSIAKIPATQASSPTASVAQPPKA